MNIPRGKGLEDFGLTYPAGDRIFKEMAEAVDRDLPYLIFSVKKRSFALSTEFIREMLALPEVTPLPDSPAWALGVINIRGRIYKLIDLRTRLGMKSHGKELRELTQSLTEREKEHRNWIDELERCVQEEREFTLGIDPHACRFGQWYDSFQTDDPIVRLELNKFDNPHRAIHATAEEVVNLARKGRKEDALEVIETRRRGELSTMITLFGNMKQVLRDTNREIAIIVELEGESFSLLVDQVEGVEDLSLLEEGRDSEDFVKDFGGRFHGKIARRSEDDQLVLLLDPLWVAGLVSDD